MAGLLRVDFVNYSKTESVTIDVVTEDVIAYRELLTTTAATTPDEVPGRNYGPGSFQLVVPAGRFFGFKTKHVVTIINPRPQLVSAIYANGKDPWPQPPPLAPPSLEQQGDFATRYTKFNTVSAEADPKPRPVAMTLTPAEGVVT